MAKKESLKIDSKKSKKNKSLEHLKINKEELREGLKKIKEGKAKVFYEELDFSRLGPKPKEIKSTEKGNSKKQ
jgi:hypothetical protein